MKTILITALLGGSLLAGACSRSEKPETTAQPTATPNLQADAARLQAATAKAAEERKRSDASPAPSVTQP